MIKKITLPNHEALWTALVAINLANGGCKKNFSQLLSEARNQFKSQKKNFSPGLGSGVPFSHNEGKLIRFLRRFSQLRGASTPRIMEPKVKKLVEKAVDGYDYYKIAKDISLLAGRDGMNALSAHYIASPFLVVIFIWAQIGLAGFYTHSAQALYDLVAADYETDPDYCTCREHLSLHQPCQKIAETLIEWEEGKVRAKALDIASFGLIGRVKKTMQFGKKSINKLVTSPLSLSPAEDFLSSKNKIATYLHQATQTYGRSVAVDEYAAEHALLGIIPGIAVDSPRACPKAISIIAALFGEFKKGSNYLETLCAISSFDGARVIENRL